MRDDFRRSLHSRKSATHNVLDINGLAVYVMQSSSEGSRPARSSPSDFACFLSLVTRHCS